MESSYVQSIKSGLFGEGRAYSRAMCKTIDKQRLGHILSGQIFEVLAVPSFSQLSKSRTNDIFSSYQTFAKPNCLKNFSVG